MKHPKNIVMKGVAAISLILLKAYSIITILMFFMVWFKEDVHCSAVHFSSRSGELTAVL